MDDFRALLNNDLILRDFVSAILDVKIRTIKGDRMGVHDAHERYQYIAREWLVTYFSEYSDMTLEAFMIEYDKRLKERKKGGKNRIERRQTKKAGV